MLFSKQPSVNAMSAHPFSVQPIINLYDKGNNLALTSNNLLTLEVNTGPNTGILHAPILNESFLNKKIILQTDNKLKFNNILHDNLQWETASPTTPTVDTEYILTSIEPYINGWVEISGNTHKYRFKNKEANFISKYANNGILDFSGNNLYLDKTGNYTLKVTISGNTNGGLTEIIDNGVKKFLKDGVGYIVNNTNVNLSTLNLVSNTILVTSGLPNSLFIETQPFGISNNNVIAGESFHQQPKILILDICGNNSNQTTNNLVVSLFNADDNLLLGLKTNNFNNGVASFENNNLRINKLGTYTLRATYETLTIDMNAINVTPNVPSYIKFKKQPSGGEINIPLIIQPVLQFYDIYDNITTKNPTTVSININQGPNNALLIGQNNILTDAVTGEAVFTDITFDKIGDYILTASTPNYSVLSESLTMSSASLDSIIFERQPIGGFTKVNFQQYPIIKLLDSGGNTLINSQNVILTTVSVDGSTGIVEGVNSLNATNGIADFSGNIRISLPGRYKLRASSGTKTVDSDIFTINNPSLTS
jgi:hypothetical protein